MHLWWARRPLATARTAIWASFVDDPSSNPEQFPTAEEQDTEHQRLFKILEELVVWENSNDERVLGAAKAAIQAGPYEPRPVGNRSGQAAHRFFSPVLPRTPDSWASCP